MRAIISAVLILTLISCMEITMANDTKPTLVEFYPPDAEVKAPGALILSGGFKDGVDYIYGKNYNHFWRQSSRVEHYLLKDTREIYVKCDAGDDSNGTGEASTPYKTIEKAYSMIAPNANTIIWMDEDGTYQINSSIDSMFKNVKILASSGITAEVQFNSYINSTDNNDLYGFNVYGGSVVISASKILVGAPADAGKDWDATASALRVYDSIANIVLVGVNEIAFSDTVASSGVPKLVKTMIGDGITFGIPFLTIVGNVKTYENGYVLDATNQLAFVNKNGTIDFSAYQATGLLYQNQVLSTGDLGGTIGTFAINIEGGDIDFPATLPIVENESDANIKTAVENFLNAKIKSGLIVATVTTTRGVGNIITALTIEIGGVYAGKKLFSNLYISGVTTNVYMEEIQAPKPLGYNVVSN